jgi:hypothetical protein
MEHYHNPFSDANCNCGRGKRLVHCVDCHCYAPACSSCFIERHRSNPFHWALVWNPENQYFVKTDYTVVLPEVTAIQIGHHGDDTFCPFTKSDTHCNIAHINGIHSTKLRYCDCPAADDKVTQLMRSRLFPATTGDPRSAFTFAVLKQSSMHNLQSKCGAFDYMLSLRHMGIFELEEASGTGTRNICIPSEPSGRIRRALLPCMSGPGSEYGL